MHILVTGASSGIGEALAVEFSRVKGAKLTLVARREERLRAIAESLTVPAHVAVADLSVCPLETDWLTEAEAELGPIDVLINNAGVQVVGPTHEVDPAQGEASLVVNLFSPLRLINTVLPSMLQRGTGTIINIASMAALAPTPGMTYYNASKAGIAGASEALGGELRGTGVRVITVYPGIIEDTVMAQSAEGKYQSSRALAMQPRASAADLAKEVAKAVRRNRARVIYPRLNAAARWFPGPTRWIMDRFAPSLR